MSDIAGRFALYIDLSTTPDEMAEWPEYNVTQYFDGIAKAYGSMIAARQAVARRNAAEQRRTAKDTAKTNPSPLTDSRGGT